METKDNTVHFVHTNECYRYSKNDKSFHYECSGCCDEYAAMDNILVHGTICNCTDEDDKKNCQALINAGYTKESLYDNEYRINDISGNTFLFNEDDWIQDKFEEILVYVNNLRKKVKTLEHANNELQDKVKTLEHENTQSKSKLE